MDTTDPRPPALESLDVIEFAEIDAAHRTAGGPLAAGTSRWLAICADHGAYFLFTCNEYGDVMADTWHESVAHAKAQAATEYPQMQLTWRSRR